MDSSELHHDLTTRVNESKAGFIEIGKLLYHLKQDNRFLEAVGEGIDTWGAYIAQPEINLTNAEANRLMQIYETFCLKWGTPENEIAEIPIKNLHYLLPIAKELNTEFVDDADQLVELLNAAETLSQRDFRERVRDIRHGEDGVRTYEYLVMKKCVETGSMQKVHGLDSETIKQSFGLQD